MTSMASSIISPPKPLDSTGDAFHSWTVWKKDFDLYATATKLKEQAKEVQAATFLMAIGEEARRSFYTFTFENDDDKRDIKILTEEFEAHFKPTTNLTFNEFRFGSRNQQEGESFNDWLTELRTLAQQCEFGALEDRMLRSRIILGINDRVLQQRHVLENLSYTKTVEICRASEQGKERFNEIQDACATRIDAVKSKANTCFKCGFDKHKSGNSPARVSNATNAEAATISHVHVKGRSHDSATKDEVYKKFR